MATDLLSALLDGECSGPELDRLLDEIGQSPELGRQWSRLCAAREAQDGVRIWKDQPCICAGVMSRLDDPAQAPAANGGNVVDLGVRRAARLSIRRLWKPAVGFAAAASVGAAAVLMIHPEVPASAPTLALGGGGSDVSPQGGALRVVNRDRDDEAYNDMLRGYWMEHRSSIGDEDVGSTLRDARVAALTATYRPEPEGFR